MRGADAVPALSTEARTSGKLALQAVELLEGALADALWQAAGKARQHAQRGQLAHAGEGAPSRGQDGVHVVRNGRRLQAHAVQAALHPELVRRNEVELPQQLGHARRVVPACKVPWAQQESLTLGQSVMQCTPAPVLSAGEAQMPQEMHAFPATYEEHGEVTVSQHGKGKASCLTSCLR